MTLQRLLIAALVVLGVDAAAQVVVPIRYRVTRTAPGQPTVQHVLPKSAMSCDLAPVPLEQMAAGEMRIGDPERPTRDCQWLDAAGALAADMVREVTYTFTVAGQADDRDPYGPESVPFSAMRPRIPQIPGAPEGPRYKPPTDATIAVVGTVLQRAPAFGLDVATAALDGIPAFPFYFGAATLTASDYAVRAGDRFVLQLWRER